MNRGLAKQSHRDGYRRTHLELSDQGHEIGGFFAVKAKERCGVAIGIILSCLLCVA